MDWMQQFPGGQFSIGTSGIYVMWRLRPVEFGHQYTRGFVIKPKKRKLFSERYGYQRGFDLGPLYFRTFGQPTRDTQPQSKPQPTLQE